MYMRHSVYPVALSSKTTVNLQCGYVLMDSILDAHSFCECDGVACRHRQSSASDVTADSLIVQPGLAEQQTKLRELTHPLSLLFHNHSRRRSCYLLWALKD